MGDTMEEESFLPNHLMVWKNILPSLDAAAAALSLGDLLHLEHFSLHESMSGGLHDIVREAVVEHPATAANLTQAWPQFAEHRGLRP